MICILYRRAKYNPFSFPGVKILINESAADKFPDCVHLLCNPYCVCRLTKTVTICISLNTVYYFSDVINTQYNPPRSTSVHIYIMVIFLC